MAEPSKQIGTRVPLSLLREIEATAEREHRPLANMVKLLLVEALEARKKAGSPPQP